jgi:hypothetical protein
MIVTKNSFVVYQLLPGTFALQAALFIISIYIIVSYPNVDREPTINAKCPMVSAFASQALTIVVCHGVLALVTFLTQFFQVDAVKQLGMLFGMIFIIMNLVIDCSLIQCFPDP